jgi:transcriptional regulator with XRE-family HTH domain
VKTLRQLLGEELKNYRRLAQLSVTDVSDKVKLTTKSIHDIEAGKQNVSPDNYEKLLFACGQVTPEDWLAGNRSNHKDPVLAKHDNLFTMLETIVRSDHDATLVVVREFLDAMADRALSKKRRWGRPREAPEDPGKREGQDARTGPQGSGQTNRKLKKQESSNRG